MTDDESKLPDDEPASPPPSQSNSSEPPDDAKKSATYAGFFLIALPTVVLGLFQMGKGGQRGGMAALEEFGVILCLLAVPATLVAIIVAIVPKSRAFGLGLLLGCGLVWLVSLFACGLRGLR